jgi:DNA-binding beta-propeller fold protein YncE
VAGIAATRTEIVVVSYLGSAVHLFDRHGNRVRSWGEHAMGIQNFSLPAGVAVDPKGRILVSDALRHDVKVFDATGKFLDHFGGIGAGPGDTAQPSGLAVNPDGWIYVAEKLGNRVQALELIEGLAGTIRRGRPIAVPVRGNWRYAMQPPPPSRGITR